MFCPHLCLAIFHRAQLFKAVYKSDKFSNTREWKNDNGKNEILNIFDRPYSFATMTQKYSEIVMVGMISYAHYLNELFCRIF